MTTVFLNVLSMGPLSSDANDHFDRGDREGTHRASHLQEVTMSYSRAAAPAAHRRILTISGRGIKDVLDEEHPEHWLEEVPVSSDMFRGVQSSG